MPLKLKTKAEYCTEVVGMSFSEIQRDQRLLNALSKALKAAQSDEQFLYLNDKKRDPTYLYETYVKSTNLPKFVNIAASMMKACEKVATDPKKLAAEIAKVSAEVELLFKTNLRPNFVRSTSCETWCNLKNEELAREECEKRGKKLAKILGIDARTITNILTALAIARFNNDRVEVAKLMKDIQAEGDKAKAKALVEALEKQLGEMGIS
ncbi:MAG: hypothetical protein J0M17_10665 [Planctomycetes bacterium]|nr:hypothetical protein [Planctomycetota bacterium]